MREPAAEVSVVRAAVVGAVVARRVLSAAVRAHVVRRAASVVGAVVALQASGAYWACSVSDEVCEEVGKCRINLAEGYTAARRGVD